MDKIDYLILTELFQDAQIPFLQIATKLGISSFTVKSRYDKMKREGIIGRSIVAIDLSKFGYQGKAFLLITNDPNTPKSITIDALKKIRNIIVISEIIGPYDIIAVAPIIDLNSIMDLVSEVKKLRSVHSVQITCINDTVFPLNPTFAKLLSRQSLNLAMQKRPRTTN